MISYETLIARITKICEPVTVVPVPEQYFKFINSGYTDNSLLDGDVRPVPVDLVPSPLITGTDQEKFEPFRLFTFYSWLRTGFRVLPNVSARRFEVYKGMGLLLPKAYERYQSTIQRIYAYQLLPSEKSAHSHYKILQIGSERRIAGVADLPLLEQDIRGYKWVNESPSALTPQISGAFSFTDEYCSRHAVPARSCGHIIRRFINPFRIMDLHLMRKLTFLEIPGPYNSPWRAKAEEILSLSMDLLEVKLTDYLAGIGSSLGRTSGALTSLRILHGSLTDHCQNITLGGELTEFDRSIRELEGNHDIEDYDSRLYSQILLVANQLRHLIDCIKWIGIDCEYADIVKPFLSGLAEVIPTSQYAAFTFHLHHDPYCLDLSLASCNHYSEENLRDNTEFLSIVQKLA